jgi:hypothetical protein
VKAAIEFFNQAFQYSLNPQGSYTSIEVDALIEVARSRGRLDIVRQISEAAARKAAADAGVPEDKPPAS